jgi:pyridine nucleotide-disulfide oxidoreductase family protein
MPTRPRLVLVGGGHSHAISLKHWGLQPLAGVDLILISDVTRAPYSGMLPGFVAGFYDFSETHIDLPSLARFAGAEFCLDRATNIDFEKNQVILEKGSPIAFDYLAIDIGTTPVTSGILGAEKYTIPAKPVPVFLRGWREILENATNEKLTIAIIGGGAGGVELALNMQAHLQRIRGHREGLQFHLIHRGDRLLPNYPDRVSQRLEKILQERGILLYLEEMVNEVRSNLVLCESGLQLATDHTIRVTSAAAPEWIKLSGLAVNKNGFIRVNNFLQSISCPRVFATGDIASIENYPRPKAGVFAVRQGKPLLANLQNIILEKPLKPYYPQKNYLSLIGTGDKKAIAVRGALMWESSLLWWWKDAIDRDFMKQFQFDSIEVN